MSDVFEKSSVSTALAHRIVAAAEEKAAEIEVPMVIAVCDESGVLKAFSRMDGAALLSVQIAQEKTYTAAGFGLSTDAWHGFIKAASLPLHFGTFYGTRRSESCCGSGTGADRPEKCRTARDAKPAVRAAAAGSRGVGPHGFFSWGRRANGGFWLRAPWGRRRL